MITLALADDHKVVRQGLRAVLSVEPDFRVVAEAGDGLEALAMVEQEQPDVLILDLMLVGLNGIEVTRMLSKRCPCTRVVILSMHSNEGYVVEALRAGASAYVLKESTAEEVVRAVREAAAGRRYLGAPLSEQAITAYLRKSEPATLDVYDTLTAREREVLHLAARGLTNAQIAARLFISRRTVEVHRANMMRKLGLQGQAELVRYALQKDILPRDA